MNKRVVAGMLALRSNGKGVLLTVALLVTLRTLLANPR
jgi:hypothetical protein